jgi:hypothetical protein
VTLLTLVLLTSPTHRRCRLRRCEEGSNGRHGDGEINEKIRRGAHQSCEESFLWEFDDSHAHTSTPPLSPLSHFVSVRLSLSLTLSMRTVDSEDESQYGECSPHHGQGNPFPSQWSVN